MLNTTQLQTLKAAILAETDPVLVAARTGGATAAMAEWYNLNSSVFVWKTNAKTTDILDSITWSSFTSNDAADGTVIYTNRLLSVQTKQMNLQNMLIGRETVDTSKVNIRAGLRDAVIALPTGALGASVSAGGASGSTVLNACTRLANNVEKLFATVDSATGTVTAKLLTYEGRVSDRDILTAINS